MVITSSTMCALVTLVVGNAPLFFSPAPRGNCQNCCVIREPKDIQFLLYTKQNNIEPDQLTLIDTKRLKRSHFNATNPTVVFIHGFSEGAPGMPGSSAYEIRKAILDRSEPYNVILVDWSPLAAMPWYANALENYPRVGRYTARFLRFIHLSGGLPVAKLHVIGFSLGAEVAGYAGKLMKEWGMMLPRITGLDPAYPLYARSQAENRLTASDADFVDVIHTDAGIFGIPWAVGHADFFPNDGVPLQPGCAHQEISRQRWLGIVFGCSHIRAYQYFAESIRRPTAFLTRYCESKALNPYNRTDSSGEIVSLPVNTIPNSTSTIDGHLECDDKLTAMMGFTADKRLRGNFFLETNDEPPFGKHFPITE